MYAYYFVSADVALYQVSQCQQMYLSHFRLSLGRKRVSELLARIMPADVNRQKNICAMNILI